MGEKKTVGQFLRKTFALKKSEEEIETEKETTEKMPARSAKRTPKKSAQPTNSKSTALKTTAAKTQATKTTAAKTQATKTTAAKTQATKTTAAKTTAATKENAAKTTTATKATAAKTTAATKATAAKIQATKTTAAKTQAIKTTVSKTSGTSRSAATKTSPANTKTESALSALILKNAPAAKTPVAKVPVSKTPVAFSKNMTKADNVRLYIYQNYFKPAKLKGQNRMTLVAGEIHSEMGLKSEIPAVASAMKTRIDRLYDVEILDVRPPNSLNSKLTVKYDLRNLYIEEEAKNAEKRDGKTESGYENGNEKTPSPLLEDSENGYLILKELEEKLRLFVSNRVETRFGKEWWKNTDMGFLADRWNERRIMNDRTNTDKRRKTNELLIHYASFSDYRRIINNPFAWDAFEEHFPDRGWIIQRLKELDPIRNAIMHHTPLEEDDYIRLGLYSRDILKIIDKSK